MGEKIEICCHTCEGVGYVMEKRYLTKKPVKVVCPECNGDRYVVAEAV